MTTFTYFSPMEYFIPLELFSLVLYHEILFIFIY